MDSTLPRRGFVLPPGGDPGNDAAGLLAAILALPRCQPRAGRVGAERPGPLAELRRRVGVE
eukprot:2742774-Lingulodinium_polyedra.AAC.1